ncbi:MAG: HAMP domain-containing histidine kinase [Actinomycetia bacterium]|nr:HAMP domain-containing histidine kinase [Actinomycetes bacterium]
MFKRARIKLSLWYMLIIMVINIFFSGTIYMAVSFAVDRGFEDILNEIKLEFTDDVEPRFLKNRGFPREDIDDIKSDVLHRLFFINGSIFIIAALASYFLAGRTLRPIEEMLEEQKRFIADASHEFRTPLTALKSSAEVALMDKKLDLKESKNIIKSSLNDIDRLKRLSDNLLSLARYQESGPNLSLEELNIADIIKEASSNILSLAEEKNISIKVKKQNIAIMGDRQRIVDLVVILLDNAIKYTPSGGKITITAKSNNGRAMLEIKDSGIGIEGKDLPHIFNRFYRADRSRSKTGASGFGLGLSLAKKIAEDHKGMISASSEPGAGTVFTVALPKK